MNITTLFPSARSEAAKRLSALGSRRDELQGEARKLRGQAAADDEQATTLGAELREAEAHLRAFGEGEGEVKRISAKVAKLEKSDGARQQELRVITDAIAAVEREAERHAREHSAELEGELREDAAQAAERLQRALVEIHEAHGQYVQAGRRGEDLLRIVAPERIPLERLPNLSPTLVALVREAPATTIAVPMPTAQDATVISA